MLVKHLIFSVNYGIIYTIRNVVLIPVKEE